jgi:hypothetical protein
MPKSDPVTFVLCGLASILLLILAAFAFSMRPVGGKPSPIREKAWSHLLIGVGFGLKSVQEYHPYPKGPHNPYVVAWSILLFFVVLYMIQERRTRHKVKPSAT